ncbi:hypothetical protein AB0P36_34175 [Streptomyces flavidovirens]|uniref:hypothetical protein n=1 Tax=Streptomyces flavidovirens TaxID=67298 RepID=UPI003444107B
MTPPRRTVRRPLAARVAAPREPVDSARIGRRVVRRRAKGMDAGAVAAALEDARFDARQDSRHEDLADDVRGRADHEMRGLGVEVAAPSLSPDGEFGYFAREVGQPR